MKKGKILKRFLIAFLIVIIGFGTVFYIGLQSKLKEFSKEVSRIEINNIDLTNIEDGEYFGEYFHNEFVGVKVKVTVIDKKIANIEILEHKAGKGKKAEVITTSVINAQGLNVDTVSGATGSSIIILKAIEEAFKQI